MKNKKNPLEKKLLAGILIAFILFIGLFFGFKTLAKIIQFDSPVQYPTDITIDPETCDVTKKGMLYYNSTDDELRFCDGTSWKPIIASTDSNSAILGDLVQSTATGTSYFTGGSVGIGTVDTGIYDLKVQGAAEVTGTLKAGTIDFGTYTGTISAINVSSGDFGSETGGGNYSFPANVGIGTTTPDATLDIKPAAGKGIQIQESDGGAVAIDLWADTAKGVIDIKSVGTTKISLNPNGDSYFNGGNVGIGITDPSSELEVAGDIEANAYYFNSSAKYSEELNGTFYTDSKRYLIFNNIFEAGENLYAGTIKIIMRKKDSNSSPNGIIEKSFNFSVGLGAVSGLISNVDYVLGGMGVVRIGEPFVDTDMYLKIPINTASCGSGRGLYVTVIIEGSSPWVSKFSNMTIGSSALETFPGNSYPTLSSKLGIGLGNNVMPSYNLDVLGTANVSGNLSVGSISGSYLGTINASNVTPGNFGGTDTAGLWNFDASSGQAKIGINYTQAEILSGTADFAVSGNVGIGTATPSAKLDVVGGSSISGIADFGTKLIMDFRLADPNVGMGIGYSNGYGFIQNYIISTGVARGFLLNPFGGNVGIGTTTPDTNLEIYNTNPILRLSGTPNGAATAYGSLEFYSRDTSSAGPQVAGKIQILAGNNIYSKGGQLAFYTADGDGAEGQDPVEAMRIDEFRNVGIGTTAPNYLLEVEGTSDFGDTMTFGNSTAGVLTYGGDPAGFSVKGLTGRYLYLGANNSTDITIDTAGNVGINDTSPDALLDVAGTAYFDDTGTYTTTYSWAGSTLQSNSIEIMDQYLGSTSDGLYPTLTFHDYGHGGAQFSMEGSTDILHLASGGSSSAGTLATGSTYFSKLKVHGDIEATGVLTAGTISGAYSGTINATDVSSGAFGSDTGGGNYSFPSTVTAAAFSGPVDDTNCAAESVLMGDGICDTKASFGDGVGVAVCSDCNSTFVNATGDSMTGNLTMSGNYYIQMQENNFINRRFEMVENASPQYILLCVNAASNNVNGRIQMDRTSGNYQSAIVDVIVSSGTSAMYGGTLKTLQVLQSSERYQLVTVTYSAVSYVAIKYTGNTYPETTGAYFTGRIVNSGSNTLTVVDSLVITDEVSFGGTSQADFDVNSLRVNNNIVWHAGNDGAGSGLVASDVSCTNCLTNTEVASADVASDLSCTGCIGTTEIEDIYVLNTGDTMTGNLTIQKNENPNLSITAINAGADPAITAAIRIKGYEGRGKGIFLTDADTTNEWFIGETYSSTGLSLGYDTTSSGLSEYPASSALFINTSRNVGIGDTTPTEGKLVVAGNIYTTGTVITSTINKTSGNLTIQTTTSGDIILTPASGEVKINGDLDIGSYKLSAGEIDPRYRIDDIVYATYGHSTTGLKEETTGKVKLAKKDNGLYSYTIDFSKVEKASDLWLFKEITAFGENWNDLVVSLTPEGRAEVWYEMDKENGFLHIFGNKSVKVSYRLIAPRFDWPERDTNLYQGDSKDSSMGMKVR